MSNRSERLASRSRRRAYPPKLRQRLPPPAAGAVQNMHGTVTFVESYHRLLGTVLPGGGICSL